VKCLTGTREGAEKVFAADPGAAERERTCWSPLFMFLLLSKDSGTYAKIP
jgi:hypothetical protein